LNVIQSKSYEFGINHDIFNYHLSEEQLNIINFICDDPEFYAMFGGESILLNEIGSIDAEEFYGDQEIDFDRV